MSDVYKRQIDIIPAMEAAKGTNINIGAENMYFEESGAYKMCIRDRYYNYYFICPFLVKKMRRCAQAITLKG